LWDQGSTFFSLAGSGIRNLASKFGITEKKTSLDHVIVHTKVDLKLRVMFQGPWFLYEVTAVSKYHEQDP